jgi:hypothetical protein
LIPNSADALSATTNNPAHTTNSRHNIRTTETDARWMLKTFMVLLETLIGSYQRG